MSRSYNKGYFFPNIVLRIALPNFLSNPVLLIGMPVSRVIFLLCLSYTQSSFP